MSALRLLHRFLAPAGLLLIALLAGAPARGTAPPVAPSPPANSGDATTLPGTSISLSSSEQDGVLAAEVTSLLPHPFATVAPLLAQVENWCQFMPLHFNIKACTYAVCQGSESLTLYSGRKTYQTPSDSHLLAYRVERRELGEGQLGLVLYAATGPAGTRDYRIELDARQVEEGTRLHIRSAYRPSTTSVLLTRTYLATLGRDKVGFTLLEQEGELRPVQGVRGIIERNVMRYYLAIDTFLTTQTLAVPARRAAGLKHWFRQNDRYPQLHEMPEVEYLAIKAREWQGQQQLQRAMDEQQRTLLCARE